MATLQGIKWVHILCIILFKKEMFKLNTNLFETGQHFNFKVHKSFAIQIKSNNLRVLILISHMTCRTCVLAQSAKGDRFPQSVCWCHFCSLHLLTSPWSWDYCYCLHFIVIKFIHEPLSFLSLFNANKTTLLFVFLSEDYKITVICWGLMYVRSVENIWRRMSP